jgi:hypothetical protein
VLRHQLSVLTRQQARAPLRPAACEARHDLVFARARETRNRRRYRRAALTDPAFSNPHAGYCRLRPIRAICGGLLFHNRFMRREASVLPLFRPAVRRSSATRQRARVGEGGRAAPTKQHAVPHLRAAVHSTGRPSRADRSPHSGLQRHSAGCPRRLGGRVVAREAIFRFACELHIDGGPERLRWDSSRSTSSLATRRSKR